MSRRFLRAEWRTLVMLNYQIDPAVLRPLVPKGTELDVWNGRHLVSVVGFLFLRTRILGVPVPFHVNFEEVNLRYYVRRQAADGWRRAVVFIKEVVPRWAVAAVARWVYNENYAACPMAHVVRLPDAAAGTTGLAEYRWGRHPGENVVRAEFAGDPILPAAGSQEEFITEHYWAYTPQQDGSTLEYRVEHPQWRVWPAAAARLTCDVRGFYGEQYYAALSQPPVSAFVAEGSPVAVYKGEGIPV